MIDRINPTEYEVMKLIGKSLKEMKESLTKYNWDNPNQTLNHYLGSLIKKQVIKRIGRGEYQFTEAGKLFLRIIKMRMKDGEPSS